MTLRDPHRRPVPLRVNAATGYSEAVRGGEFVFVSGQVAVDEEGRTVGVGDARAQARRAFANLRRALEESGSSLDRIVKITMFATSREHLVALREVRHEIFDPLGYYPASTFVVVAGLASDEFLVEIEALAVA